MKQDNSKIVEVAGTCATIGATAAASIAAAVSAPVTAPIVLIGGVIGCLGGAILSSKNNK